MGVHPVDLFEAIRAADADYAAGLTEQTRAFRRIRNRFAEGECDSESLEIVRHELLDEQSRVRKAWLVGMLALCPPESASEEAILQRFSNSADPDELNVALRVVANWSPQLFEQVAPGFILGARGPEDTRAWALSCAGSLLRDRLAPGLLQHIEKTASDPHEGERITRSARVALANAAGMTPMDAATSGVNDTAVTDLIARARRRVYGR
jgi:hypothetical protein